MFCAKVTIVGEYVKSFFVCFFASWLNHTGKISVKGAARIGIRNTTQSG
jgi:hypothetical protein